MFAISFRVPDSSFLLLKKCRLSLCICLHYIEVRQPLPARDRAGGLVFY